jgi:hypothetical protein
MFSRVCVFIHPHLKEMKVQSEIQNFLMSDSMFTAQRKLGVKVPLLLVLWGAAPDASRYSRCCCRVLQVAAVKQIEAGFFPQFQSGHFTVVLVIQDCEYSA